MIKPITQSREWQRLQDDLNQTCFFEKGIDYQYLAILHSTPVGKYLYLPYGPIASDEAGFQAAIDSLMRLAKKQHAVFVRVEPQNTDFSQFLPTSSVKVKDISPADTWVLDLTADKEQIIRNFSQGTRTRFHNYMKKGLTVETTCDTEQIYHLVELQNRLFNKKHLTAYDESYLKAELRQPFSTLYLVHYNQENDTTRGDSATDSHATPSDGQVLAASLFFDYGGTRYYMQSAADQDYKKLPATVALLTSAIFDAKEQGIKRFDFWGIAPDGAPASHPWHGFTEFKKSFGGEARHYAGTYDIILQPLRYRLYQFLRSIRP